MSIEGEEIDIGEEDSEKPTEPTKVRKGKGVKEELNYEEHRGSVHSTVKAQRQQSQGKPDATMNEF